MDGFTACELIKENPVTRHIPIIMLTAETSVEFKLKSREVGAADYVLKPPYLGVIKEKD